MTYAAPMKRYPGRSRSSARIVHAAMMVAGRLYRSSSALTPERPVARALLAPPVTGPASGVPSPCVMKLPQLAVRKVSPGRPVMTVCESSVLAPFTGKDAKRDARRSTTRATVTFVAWGDGSRVARFYTRQSLCTRWRAPASGRGLLQVDKTGFFRAARAVFSHGMRAATGSSEGSPDSRIFCQIGDRGT